MLLGGHAGPCEICLSEVCFGLAFPVWFMLCVCAPIPDTEGHPEQLEGLKQGPKQSWFESTKLLLVPVHSHFHWTLLAAQREGPGQPITWRRLPQQRAWGITSSWGTCLTLSSPFHYSATLLGSLWVAMPVAAMCSTTWSKKSGFSEESSLQFGLRVGGRAGSSGWRCCQAQMGGLQSQKTSIAEQKKKAEAKLSKLKDITSVAYITPQEQLDKNSVKFTPNCSTYFFQLSCTYLINISCTCLKPYWDWVICSFVLSKAQCFSPSFWDSLRIFKVCFGTSYQIQRQCQKKNISLHVLHVVDFEKLFGCCFFMVFQ